MSDYSGSAPVYSPKWRDLFYTTVPYEYQTRLPSVWKLEKSFPACCKECDKQLHSTLMCFGEEEPIPKLSPDMVLFVCFKSSLCPSVSCNKVVLWKWNALPESPLPSLFVHFLSCCSLFSPLSFIPMRREAWLMKSSLSACLSLLPPATSLPLHANLTYKFCPSVTNERVVELQPSSFLSVSSCCVWLCPPVCVLLPSLSVVLSLHLSLF